MANYIYAHTETKMNYYQDRKITANQWKIYYYLLSISKYDSQSIEEHRFVYKDSISIAEICRFFGIKSKQTYYNSIKKLKMNGLIEEWDRYFLIFAKNWVEIDVKILKALLNFGRSEPQSIDLLRTYLIIKKLKKIGVNKDSTFTIKDIVILLGHDGKDTPFYDRVRAYISLLGYWNLIILKKHSVSNKIGGYMLYHIQKADEKNVDPDLVFNLEAEMQASGVPEEIMEELKSLSWISGVVNENDVKEDA